MGGRNGQCAGAVQSRDGWFRGQPWSPGACCRRTREGAGVDAVCQRHQRDLNIHQR